MRKLCTRNVQEERTLKRKPKITLERAQELLAEEYEKGKRLDYVRCPLAYALYQVWKRVDAERIADYVSRDTD